MHTLAEPAKELARAVVQGKMDKYLNKIFIKEYN